MQTFSIDKVTASADNCPGYLVAVTDQSGNEIDQSIFTFDEKSSTLETSSSELAQADSYPLRLTAIFDANPADYP